MTSNPGDLSRDRAPVKGVDAARKPPLNTLVEQVSSSSGNAGGTFLFSTFSCTKLANHASNYKRFPDFSMSIAIIPVQIFFSPTAGKVRVVCYDIYHYTDIIRLAYLTF